MHGFFPAPFLFFGPALLFFGLLKLALFVLLIVLIVRLVTHGRRHGAYAHGHGYGPAGYNAQNTDPRRIAAWRFASGQIDRAEFDRIMIALDSSTPVTPPAPPTAPTPQG